MYIPLGAAKRLDLTTAPLRWFAALLILAVLLPGRLAVAAPGNTPGEPGAIQDNSFLLEEAYNQEFGVMQTILTYTRTAGTGEWLSTITQEFPLPAETHQLSYLLGLAQTQDENRGFGDLTLNYR
ncbi:MAG: hypothetical protein ABIT01_10395, partial [Thermoanaerobaculia bacterium]